jgi:hypothetical protein
MPNSDHQFLRGHHAPRAGIGSENGQPVPTCGFAYPGDAEPGAVDYASQDAALMALRGGVLLILDGHRDSAKTRAAALARLCGLFASDAEAARAVKVRPSTLWRAVAKMRQELRRDLRNGETPAAATPRKASTAPPSEFMQRPAY